MVETVLWNNVWLRTNVLALCVLVVSGLGAADDVLRHTPQLLLTAQRLRRLQRDRERQTARWINFENRVKGVPDSSERGFELALYYAVTGDEGRGKEAMEWGTAHPCSRRQVALILDWTGDLATAEERRKLSGAVCDHGTANPIEAARDDYFAAIARQNDAETNQWPSVLAWLEAGNLDGRTLYAACEYLLAARANEHADLREEARAFFAGLPAELLLSRSDNEIAHPDWMTHAAALALVAVDPNLEGSQYVQSWAMEDAQ
ncbi:MAG: hypothetical protein JO091_00560, partial [Acidobacteriaceae bacterium]|nr:hypothetical protein [Acidobacteriaceae bacterium]